MLSSRGLLSLPPLCSDELSVMRSFEGLLVLLHLHELEVLILTEVLLHHHANVLEVFAMWTTVLEVLLKHDS